MPALVAVEQEPAAFAALFEAARGRGVRVGWLDLSAPASATAPALEAGAAKRVAVETGRVSSFKRVVGKLVLRDLLREHFTGYGVVLVTGEAAWPRWAAAGERWTLHESPTRRRELGAEELLAELLRPKRRA
jgi:hypothetical protein